MLIKWTAKAKRALRGRGAWAAAVGATAFLVGCANPPAAPRPAPAASANAHPEQRFFVEYGDSRFLVNARYVKMVSRSVVAVRRAEDPTPKEGWRRLIVATDAPLDPAGNLEDTTYETAARRIAGAVEKTGRVCLGEAEMRLSRDDDGVVRTSYRRDRKAWIVFAACGAPQL